MKLTEAQIRAIDYLEAENAKLRRVADAAVQIRKTWAQWPAPQEFQSGLIDLRDAVDAIYSPAQEPRR